MNHLPFTLRATLSVFAVFSGAAVARSQAYDDTPEMRALAYEAQRAKYAAEIAASQKAKAEADKAIRDGDNARTDDLAAALAKLGEASGKVPAGTYAASGDLVATPATTQLAIEALGGISKKIYDQISASVDRPGMVVIFGEPPTPPIDVVDFSYFEIASDRIGARLDRFAHDLKNVPTTERYGLTDDTLNGILDVGGGGAGGAHPKGHRVAITAAAGVVAALPAALSFITGLFKADITENAGDVSIGAGTLQNFVQARFTHATVYPSLDHYAYSRITAVDQLVSITKTEALVRRHGFVAAGLEETEKAIAKPLAAFAASKVELAAANAAHAKARKQLEKAEEALAAGTGSQADVDAAQGKVRAAEKEVSEAEAEVARQEPGAEAMTARQAAFTEMDSLLATYIASLAATEGGQPKLMNIIRKEIVSKAVFTEPGATLGGKVDDKLHFVSLTPSFKPQSTIQKKYVLWTSRLATALVGVEYQVADALGKSRSTGFQWVSVAAKIPRVPKAEKTLKLNASGSVP